MRWTFEAGGVEDPIMSTTKEEALRLIRALPDDCTLADVQYQLDLLGRVQEGLVDIEAGRVIPHEEVRKRLARSRMEARARSVAEPWREADHGRGTT
jgi:predicted transcriptional regulator